MDFQSPSSSTTTGDKVDNTAPSKQAACLNCRRSKTRCLRDEGSLKCKKCAQSGSECVVPEYRVGRKKGIKNKRDGLEKAVYRIEQAIKKHKTNGTNSDDNQIQHLEGLLTNAQQLLPEHQPDGNNDFQREESSSSSQRPTAAEGSADDGFAVHDAENPLQLLARASDLSVESHPVRVPAIQRTGTAGDQVLRDFFGPFRPSLDNGVDVDPIEMGLVTPEETTDLFNYFHDNLSHTRWGLDPILHTPQFVRRQSAFLFSSILAASSLFIPSAGAISRRLHSHTKLLARQIFASGYRSPEIVLGFMINMPWMAPGKHWSDDDTCSYMSMALTAALDISLDKLIVPSPSELQGSIQKGRAQSECITARKALDMDGFSDVDPLSELGRRLLRRRERIWLSLFVLDRGVCLARGRSFIVPVTPLIETCDEWHRCSIADMRDSSIVSSTILRRDLVKLISEVKTRCKTKVSKITDGSKLVESLQAMIDGFFNTWYSTWGHHASKQTSTIPPYVEILVTHGRLSIYSSVINHPTAPLPVKRFFRAAGLSASLNVMRAAVQGEFKLQSMPNNTCIMISFAACFAVYLSTTNPSSKGSLTPSVRMLIEESACVLERIGTVTPHRNGTSYLYGRHLREIISSSLANNFPQLQVSNDNTQNQFYFQPPSLPVSMPTLLQFSAMSDNQINEAINSVAGEEDFDFEAWSKMPEPMGLAGGLDDSGLGIGGGIGGLERAGMGMQGLDWLDWFNVDVGSGIT